jgi:hypothetical protein
MLRYYYLTWFSTPAADRTIYQAVHNGTFRSIVELGVGTGVRTKRLFELAVKPQHTETPLRYTGIDLFEARPANSPGMKLKQAFQTLQTPNVKVQLVPGDPFSALSRMANTLSETDLLVIGLDQAGESLNQAWRYVPRMLHPETMIFFERPEKKAGETKFELLKPVDIQRYATASSKAQRKAA